MIQYGYRKRKKRGISTVLGILLMVGVLFTSIIPIFMYVNEVNNYYDRTVVNMKISDDERSREDLTVYAYGKNATAINVFIKNSGSVSMNITRVWVIRADLKDLMIFNSTNRPDDFTLQLLASAQETIIGLNLAKIITWNTNLDYFNIFVTTKRGNKFSSSTNTLHRTEDGWETSTLIFQIEIIIQSSSNEHYKLTVYNSTIIPKVYITDKVVEDVHGSFFTIIDVPEAGAYNVTIQRREGQEYGVPFDERKRILTWSHPITIMEFRYPPS